MPTTFPTTLDDFTNPTPADNLSTPAVLHSTQHASINDAVEALEAKVGVDSSAVTASLDYKVANRQPLDATLTSIALLGTAADKMLYTTALDTWAETGLSAFARTILDDANGTAVLATIGGQAALTLPLSAANGGTGVANTGTITNASNTTITGGGTVALGGFTLTVPATGTAALLATANVFTAIQKINVNSTLALLAEQDGVKDNVFIVDTTNARVGINGVPTTSLTLTQKATTDGFIFTGMSIGGVDTGTGCVVALGYNALANKQLWFGDVDYLGLSTGYFNRLVISTGAPLWDVVRGDNLAYGALNLGKTGGSKVVIGDSSISATQPGSQLYIGGGVSIGSDASYRSAAAPASGMIIAGSVGIGSTSASAKLHIIDSTTTTNAVLEVERIQAIVSTASTGGSAGFGVGLSWYAETATNNTSQPQGIISTSWIDATNATRKAKLSLSAYDTAARLGMEIEASGTAARLAFYGGTTVVRGAALTTQLTTITFTAPTPDYAIQNLTNVAPYGFVTQDEGNTVLSVIANLQTRVAELEARLGSATGVNLFI